MNFKVFLSVAVCVAFVAFVCLYLYFKDRYDKESKRLLLLLFALGGAIGAAVFFAESLLTGNVLNHLFKSYIVMTLDGMLTFTSAYAKMWYYLVQNIVVSTLLSIALKVIALILVTRKNRNFNSLFDGVIYACYIFISAAFFESICFAALYGWDLFMSYFFFNACIQTLAGVLLGYYYTMWYMNSLARSAEEDMHKMEIVQVKKYIKPSVSLLKGIGLSVALCGFFGFISDFAVIYRSPLCTAVVFVSLILSMTKISYLAKNDTADELIATGILLRKYKTLSDKKEQIITIINKYTN